MIIDDLKSLNEYNSELNEKLGTTELPMVSATEKNPAGWTSTICYVILKNNFLMKATE